jgi:Domain of unknown function (DUF1906)
MLGRRRRIPGGSARKRSHSRFGLFSAAVVAVFVLSGPPPANASYNNSLYSNDNGFDTCLAKSQTMLTGWWTGTPWYEIGMYLGGSVGHDKGCDDGTAAVDRALNTGYAVTLYWYGPQNGSGCQLSTFTHYFSSNTTTAYNQGVAEADLAKAAATAAGLPTLTRIFYDMEGYATSGTNCRTAAKSFINGWDHELAVNSPFWGAAYGSSCASYPTDWAGISDVPVAISPSGVDARNPNGGIDNGSAYGYLCLSDSLWVHDQRVGQFSTDTSDSNGNPLVYNGVHLSSIDENCADSYLPSIFGTESQTCNDID